MPEVSRFYGIIIRMFPNDHPPPHFHAVCGEDEERIIIESLRVLSGTLPRPRLDQVMEWAALHQEELRENWTIAQSGNLVRPIAPLP